MKYYRILTPACEVPDGAKVTKRTGEKVYTFRKAVKVYSKSGPRPFVFSPCGDCYLFDTTGIANAVDPHCIVVRQVSLDELIEEEKVNP